MNILLGASSVFFALSAYTFRMGVLYSRLYGNDKDMFFKSGVALLLGAACLCGGL